MNIEKANDISLSSILQKIGLQPAKKRGHDEWFYSPFRQEKTPSFHVNTAKNVWYDFGEAKGGSVINFVKTYLQSQNEDHTVVDVLRWLKNMQETTWQENRTKEIEGFVEDETKLNLRKVTQVQSRTLVDYLKARGIPLIFAKKYLKEIHVLNKSSGKPFFALGLANENGGYELRNKFFKGSITSKGLSFIRGATMLPDEIHVFEGIMDFLSAIELQKEYRFEGDVIILNSLSNLSQAFPYIKNYTYKKVYSWLDNDHAGMKSSKVLKEFVDMQETLSFYPMHEIYAPYKDVNEWHINKLKRQP